MRTADRRADARPRPSSSEGTLVAVEVDGLRGERYILGSELPLLDAAAIEVGEASDPLDSVPPPKPDGLDGVTLLAPLDPFVWDRDFIRRLHGFDYVWEVYVPERKRRWGYYVLPVLFGDRLVGRIEPRIDRKAGAVRVLDLWWEDGLRPARRHRASSTGWPSALTAHRRFAGMRRVVLPRTARHRDLARELRPRLG